MTDDRETRLAGTLSGLVRQGVGDLRALLGEPDTFYTTEAWYGTRGRVPDDGVRDMYVSLPGAVMVRSCGVDHPGCLSVQLGDDESVWTDGEIQKLMALSALEQGKVSEALRLWTGADVPLGDGLSGIEIPNLHLPYLEPVEIDMEPWMAALETAADRLETAGY